MATKITKMGLKYGVYGVTGSVGPKGLTGTKGLYKEMMEKEKLKNMKEIIDALSEAILETGRPFKDIPKSSITDYLTKVGVNKSKHDEIYQKLTEIYTPKQKNYKNIGDTERNSKYQVVDYTDTTHNDVKERQPRKNVFSEITKIH